MQSHGKNWRQFLVPVSGTCHWPKVLFRVNRFRIKDIVSLSVITSVVACCAI